MRIDSSGNVGIGLTSPSQKLEVSGNALASNLISSGYVKLGADNQILSDGSITIDIDYNNNQTDRFFKVRKDNSTDLFTISEDASASFVGDVTITKSDPTLILEDTSGTDNQARIWLRESASYGVQLEYQSDVSDFFQISMIDANVGNTNPIPALTINRNTNATFANDVTVTGNLTVSGTTTTIDTTNLNVEDKNITINYSTGDSSSTADGAGITIQDAVDSSTNATLLWNATQDRFNFSHAVQLPDSTLLYLGSDSDMNVQHTGSDGFIMNDTGHLYIRNRADDKDIIFKGQDSTSEITALTLDMSEAGLANFNNDVVAFYSSDERLKDNVVKIGDPLMKLSELRGVEFDWNKNKEVFEGEHSYGVIAQEVEKVIPEIVHARTGGIKGVKYEKIIPLLIECIKQLQEQINKLKFNNYF